MQLKSVLAQVILSANLERICVEEPGRGGGGLKEAIYLPNTPFSSVKVCAVDRFHVTSSLSKVSKAPFANTIILKLRVMEVRDSSPRWRLLKSIHFSHDFEKTLMIGICIVVLIMHS